MDQKSRDDFDMMRYMDAILWRQHNLLDRIFERAQRGGRQSEQREGRTRREGERALEIENGDSIELNDTGVLDECECIADLSENGVVDTTDLLVLLGAWGACE